MDSVKNLDFVAASKFEAAGTPKRWMRIYGSAMKALLSLLLLAGGIALMPTEAAAQSFLLSNFPGATVLLSTTKENGNYLGAALRVRRTSDNTEQDIPFSGKWADVT